MLCSTAVSLVLRCLFLCDQSLTPVFEDHATAVWPEIVLDLFKVLTVTIQDQLLNLVGNFVTESFRNVT